MIPHVILWALRYNSHVCVCVFDSQRKSSSKDLGKVRCDTDYVSNISVQTDRTISVNCIVFKKCQTQNTLRGLWRMWNSIKHSGSRKLNNYVNIHLKWKTSTTKYNIKYATKYKLRIKQRVKIHEKDNWKRQWKTSQLLLSTLFQITAASRSALHNLS